MTKSVIPVTIINLPKLIFIYEISPLGGDVLRRDPAGSLFTTLQVGLAAGDAIVGTTLHFKVEITFRYEFVVCRKLFAWWDSILKSSTSMFVRQVHMRKNVLESSAVVI